MHHQVRLADSLQKVVFTFPRQQCCSQYEKLLLQKLDKNTIVRWYASSISDTFAKLEVIVESKGVGKSESSREITTLQK